MFGSLSLLVYLSTLLPVVCSIYIVFKRYRKYSCPYCTPAIVLERVNDTKWYCESCNGTFSLSADQYGEKEWIPIIPDTLNVYNLKNSTSLGNGLCRLCNHHQTIIVHFLSQLDKPEELPRPRLESFIEHLEKKYPLCATCQYIVQKRLESQRKKLKSKLELFLSRTRLEKHDRFTLTKFLKTIIYFIHFLFLCLFPHILLSNIIYNQWMVDTISSYDINHYLKQMWIQEFLWIICTYILLVNRVFSSWKRVIWCFIVRPKVGTLLFPCLSLYIHDNTIINIMYYVWITLDFIIMRHFKNAYIANSINVFNIPRSKLEDDGQENQYLLQKSHPFSTKYVQTNASTQHRFRPSILSVPPVGLEDSFASFGINEESRIDYKKNTMNITNILIIIFIISIILTTNLPFSQLSTLGEWIRSSFDTQ